MESPQRIRGLGRWKRLLWLAVPATLLLAVLLTVVFSVRQAFNCATQTVERAGQLPFTLRTLDAASPARIFGGQIVAAHPNYTTGAFFLGDLYLGGQSGLTILRANGSSRLTLRSGFELPVAPIHAMAVARVRGTSEPQLLIATSGAGLLLVESGSGTTPTIHQLLPAVAAARDLTALLPLPTGEVLLGTRHRGVLVYNGAMLAPLQFTLPGVNSATLQITALAAVDSTSFLVGTRDLGVFYIHAGTVDQASSASGLPDDQVESIAVSSAHAFIGTPTGTAEFDLASPSFRPVHLLAQGLFGHALTVEGQQLVVGTLDQGIQQVPLHAESNTRRISISAGHAESSQRVDAFITAPDSLYALVDGALLRRSGAGWTRALLLESAALTDANISALAFAPDGTLYIGYFDHGIDLLSPEGTVRHLENDHLFCINRLAVDPQRHTMDAGTADGLVLFDARGRPRQTLTQHDGLISDHISDVSFNGNDTVVATPAGITFLGPSGAESLYAFQGLVNNHVYALASPGGSGQLIAGTLGGISILRSNVVERNLTVSNSGLKHNWITALLPMPEKSVLVGTYGGGLETLDSQGRFAPIELPSGTPRDLVINPNALYETTSHIYVGTLGNGMLVYSLASGRWSAITTELPSLNVTAFAAHGSVIYIGTENGLVRIPEANLP